MAIKSLFEIDEAYSDEALELSNELRAILFPFFHKWTDKGYSPRAILTIVIHEATSAELDVLFVR